MSPKGTRPPKIIRFVYAGDPNNLIVENVGKAKYQIRRDKAKTLQIKKKVQPTTQPQLDDYSPFNQFFDKNDDDPNEFVEGFFDDLDYQIEIPIFEQNHLNQSGF